MVLTPYAAKELARWLSDKVREYEEKHGEIVEEDMEKIREIEERYKEIEESRCGRGRRAGSMRP